MKLKISSHPSLNQGEYVSETSFGKTISTSSGLSFRKGFSTAYFCLIIIIVLDFFYFNISYKVLLSSLLIILSSIFILFTFWSILVWGFTTSMLVSLNKKKGYKITKEKWIRVYCNNQNLNTFTKDRIQLLYLINVIKKQNKNVTITANGYIISFLYKILKNFFV